MFKSLTPYDKDTILLIPPHTAVAAAVAPGRALKKKKKRRRNLSLSSRHALVLPGVSSASLLEGRAIEAPQSKQGMENGLLSCFYYYYYCLLMWRSFLGSNPPNAM